MYALNVFCRHKLYYRGNGSCTGKEAVKRDRLSSDYKKSSSLCWWALGYIIDPNIIQTGSIVRTAEQIIALNRRKMAIPHAMQAVCT